MKTAWHWYIDRQVDQWKRIADPEIKSHTLMDTLSLKKKPKRRKTENIFNKFAGLTGS